MKITEIPYQKAPLSLLLDADPCEEKVKSYLCKSICYGALKQDKIIAVCVLLPLDDSTVELMNIAVHPEHQAKGIGTELLNHAIEAAKAMNYKKLVVGTGSFGYQLAFYQKAGFRVSSIDRDFFLKNYPEPIFDSGIQLKDMIRLEIEFVP